MKVRKLEKACPDCGSDMILRPSKYGLFYGCTQYPKSKSTHGAHPDGKPLGIPANKETKEWRMRAHDEFDGLWKGKAPVMNRKESYVWMQKTMEMTTDEAHIGKFDIKQCQDLIEAITYFEPCEES